MVEILKDINTKKSSLTQMFNSLSPQGQQTFKEAVFDTDYIDQIMLQDNGKKTLVVCGTSFTGEEFGSLIKLIEKDNAVLEYLDVTRLIMFAGFILLSLVNIKEFKSYITIIYIVTCTAIGLTGLLVLAINRFQNQMDAYYITIAIFLMIAILLPIGYSILINKKKDITIEDKNN